MCWKVVFWFPLLNDFSLKHFHVLIHKTMYFPNLHKMNENNVEKKDR